MKRGLVLKLPEEMDAFTTWYIRTFSMYPGTAAMSW